MPRKRSGKRLETEQLNVRLPVVLVEDLHKAAAARGWPLSKEIRERLAGSIFDDAVRVKDPGLSDLLAQIGELSRRVRQHYGAPWSADALALAAFKVVARQLVADLPMPAGAAVEPAYPPELVADVIYRGYVAERREPKETGTRALSPHALSMPVNERGARK